MPRGSVILRGALLRRRREELLRTQEDFADADPVMSLRTLQRCENGRPVGPDTAREAAAKYQLTVELVVDREATDGHARRPGDGFEPAACGGRWMTMWEEIVRSGIREYLSVSLFDSLAYARFFSGSKSLRITRELCGMARTRIFVVRDGLWNHPAVRRVAEEDRAAGIEVLVTGERRVLGAAPHLFHDVGYYETAGKGILNSRAGRTLGFELKEHGFDPAERHSVRAELGRLSVPLDDPYLGDLFHHPNGRR